MAERKFEVVANEDTATESTNKHPVKQANIKPPTLAQKVKKAFIANEVGDVRSYALFDVVIPAAKRVIKDLIMNSIDMVFYGKPMGRERDRNRSPYYDYEYTRYSRSSRDRDRDDDRRSDRQRTESRPDVGVRDLDRVMFAEKEDAIDALGYLFDNIEEYGVATVADFLSNAGITTNPIHNKWGWYDLRGSSVREDPDGGWYCDMPKPRGIT
jgi:hypothetical protein